MSKYNYKDINYILLVLMISLFIPSESSAQIYSFSEIKEIFLQERPQTGKLTIREDCFGSIDDLIIGTYPPLHPETKWFFRFMLEKAILEIRNENLIEGATIWQIYNHGFVVKTPSITMGFDLYHYYQFYSNKNFLELANLLDIYFISHEHGDHYSQDLINAMTHLNKPVVGPAEFSLVPIKMNAGESKVIAGLNVTAHDGLHSVPVRQFEITTSEGLKFLHTGDNQTSQTLPLVTGIDVLMLNCWINESGAVSWIEGIRIAIDKIKPQVTLPGHMMELGHLGGTYPPVPYRDPIASDNGSLASEYYILGWGERYHYNNTTNDSIRPNVVENLSYTINSDTIVVSWDFPQIAADGDTASFYRVIVNDNNDFLIAERKLRYTVNSSGLFNFKVYSYDECGNQSEAYAEITGIDPNIIYSNRALRLTISGDYVEIAHDESISPANITMECWINLEGEVGEQTIIDKRDANGGYNLRIAGDDYPLGVAVVIKDTKENIMFVDNLLDKYTWYHLSATYDGSIIKLYLNGELSGSMNSNKDITNTLSTLRIGEYGGYPSGSFMFRGLIDDLHLWNKALSKAEIESNMNNTITGNELHLISYWKFDETTSTTIADAGLNQNNGSLKGNSKTVPSTAPINEEAHNHAIQVNQQGAMVEIPHADELSPSQITLECWIKKNTNLSYEYTIADKRGNDSGYNFRLAGTSFPLGTFIVFDGNGESVITGSPNHVQANTWYHIAATYDGNIAQLYVDGELIASQDADVDISKSNSSLRIGELQGYPGFSLNFLGDIDEFRIWNYARSQTEIKALMHKNLSAMEPGLIGYWRFNEAKGSVAYDKSEFENSGVVSSNAYFIESEAAIGFIPPQKPVGFRAIGTDNLVTLLWKANDNSDIDHYVIYRSANSNFEPAPENAIATVDNSTTSYVDASLSNGERRYYRLKAVDKQAHYSQPSLEVAGKPAEIYSDYLTGVYYYPWYSNTWGHEWPGQFVRDYLDPVQTPVLGQYDSRDRSVIRQHLDWCNQYGIDLWVCSWWGVNSREDITIKDYIKPELTANDAKFAIFYESFILGQPPWEIDSNLETELINDYTYIANTYFNHPNYFKINNHPVVYIYISGLYQGDYISAFTNVRQTISNLGYDIYLVGDEINFGEPTDHMNFLDAVTSYIILGAQDYGIDTDFFGSLGATFSEWENEANERNLKLIPVAVPGFNNRKAGQTSPNNSLVVPRQSTEGASQTSYFEEYIKVGRPFVDSDLKLMMITSWNEWHEDTQIEPINIAPPTNQDNSGTTYTNGYYYEGYGMKFLKVAQELLASGTTNIGESAHTLPTKFVMFQNNPNPFNALTYINYHLPKESEVILTIFNVLGQRIKTLVNQNQQAGKYKVLWDGSDEHGFKVRSGIYFYRFEAGDFAESFKIVLIQ